MDFDFTWTDRENNKDYILADDVNALAGGIIETQQKIEGLGLETTQIKQKDAEQDNKISELNESLSENISITVGDKNRTLKFVAPAAIPELYWDENEQYYGDHLSVDVDLQDVFFIDGRKIKGYYFVYDLHLDIGDNLSDFYVVAQYNFITDQFDAYISREFVPSSVSGDVWTFSMYRYSGIQLEFKVSDDSPTGSYYVLESYGAYYAMPNEDSTGETYTFSETFECIRTAEYLATDNKNSILDAVNELSDDISDEQDERIKISERLDAAESKIGGKANLTYCTCTTTVNAAEKIAEISAGTFELKEGAPVEVKFKYTNTATAPTLNVNGTGAKPIKAYGTTAPSMRMWQAGAVVRFIYDGENWLMLNGTQATTAYYGVTKLSSSVSSTSTSEAATSSAVKSAYDLANNAIPKTQRGAANGVASLDTDGKVPLEQIPEGVSILPRLEVTGVGGAIVTVTDGTTTLTEQLTGFNDFTAVFDVPSLGIWTVTSGNYSKEITVDTVKIYKITAITLQDAAWVEINQISQEGRASLIWSIGDEKDITVGDETLTLQIYDFNHDDLADGDGKAGITFGLKNLMAETRAMNSTDTNVGGFTGSQMYAWLQGDLLNSLPQDLRAVLKSVNKKTSAGDKSKTINTDAMKLFLFSEVEVFGDTVYSLKGEGYQYPYFATTAQRKKFLSNGTGSAYFWWERSPWAWGAKVFCMVHNDGTTNTDYASGVLGVCFGFCV